MRLAKDGPYHVIAIGRGGIATCLWSIIIGDSRCRSVETSVSGSCVQEAVPAKPLACCKKVACGDEVRDGGSEGKEGETWQLRD